MKVHIFNRTEKDVKEFNKLIRLVFRVNKNKKEFNIIFVDDEYIQKLNRDYRKIDRITDVISFALCDDPDNPFDDELGDIFICLDQAYRQAAEYEHTIEREVAFLAVHGYLHLCGYDHITKEDEEIMFAKQEQMLLRAGLKR